ncbi:MAG: hypothetical protein ABW034_05625 [Steroidobacteraceae bacterium]
MSIRLDAVHHGETYAESYFRVETDWVASAVELAHGTQVVDDERDMMNARRPWG